MIDRALIDSFSQSLSLAKDAKRFWGEAWKLIEAVKDDVVAAFPGLIGTVEHRTNEGMTYVGGNLAGGASFLYLLFGICLDPTLSKIPFKRDFQPEYIVRLTIDKSDRTRLGEEAIFQDTGDMVSKGFELNKGDPMRHPWTICLWHDSMINYAFDDVAQLATLFKEKLNILFESQFFKHLGSISR